MTTREPSRRSSIGSSGPAERLCLLFEFGPSFERITLGALWADSRLGTRYISVMDGCALVTDFDWVREPARGIARWLPCPMQVYDNAHRDAAAHWLSSLPALHAPSAAQTATAYLGGTGGAAFNTAKLLISRGFRR
jgi:SpoIIAA-like